jgi:hypothetical protein
MIDTKTQSRVFRIAREILAKTKIQRFSSFRNLYIAVTVFYLILVANLPIQIITYFIHDDAMFWTQASSILKGEWLGPYSQMILPKGSGFPIILAISSILSVPANLASAIILVTSLLVLIRALRLFDVPEIVNFLIFCLTLLQTSLILVRPLRDSLYASATLILVAGILNLASKEKKFQKIWLFSLGIGGGLFFITREEYPWVLPGLLVILLGVYLKQKTNGEGPSRFFKRLSMFGFGFATLPLLVMSFNFISYGTFTTQDFTYGSFPKALSNLQSVAEHPRLQYVPVGLENRNAIYEVSPAFSELRSYFEGPGLFWTKFGCAFEGQPCDEYAAGWFMWALRDAVASAGHYTSPQTADAFYNRLSDEVSDACSDGSLKCESSGLSIIPSLPTEAYDEIAPNFLMALDVLLYKDAGTEGLGFSQGEPRDVYEVRNLLGSARSMPLASEGLGVVSGWSFGPESPLLTISCEPGVAQPELVWTESKDLVEFFGDERAGNNRFQFTYSNNQSSCSLELTQGQLKEVFLVSELTSGMGGSSGVNQLYIDSFTPPADTSQIENSYEIKNWMTLIAKLVNPILFFGGLLSFAIALLFQLVRRRLNYFSTLITGGLLTLVISRLSLLAAVAVIAFPAHNAGYAAPAIVLLPVAGLISMLNLVREINQWTNKFSLQKK